MSGKRSVRNVSTISRRSSALRLRRGEDNDDPPPNSASTIKTSLSKRRTLYTQPTQDAYFVYNRCEAEASWRSSFWQGSLRHRDTDGLDCEAVQAACCGDRLAGCQWIPRGDCPAHYADDPATAVKIVEARSAEGYPRANCYRELFTNAAWACRKT